QAVTVSGPATLSGSTFTAGTAPIAFDGGLTLDGGNFTGAAGPVSAAGVRVTAGQLTAPTSTLSDTGHWSVTGGVFVAHGGTGARTGRGRHGGGSTTFFNRSKIVAAADTVAFQAGTTQTVTGALTRHGAAGNLLALQSSAPGTPWDIDPQGSRAL